MTQRQLCSPAPGPLEAYAAQFDACFTRINQRAAFRQYLAGLLLPAERNKTLTALANTEPIRGAQRPEAQSLQWFLSESSWDPDAVNRQRLALLCAEPRTAPRADGVLVIDEHGDRKWGTKTAHVARQYLANLGKIDSGVVSVTSLYADAGLYYPLHVKPYTPAQHFAAGKEDSAFRTKLQLALELLDAATKTGITCRAVVADCFYGDDAGFRAGLEERHLGYVMALKPSHRWWHRRGDVGSLQQAAAAAGWTDAQHPGTWVRVVRAFRDGHTEEWWALEVCAGPYGPKQSLRAVIATTDPATLPEHTTWYLVTNLPAPGTARARDATALPSADLAEIVRLYGLRMWVEQSYKHTKGALGWSQYQVRADLAIRRHWQLVCCAFSFCWLHQERCSADDHDAPAHAGTTSSPAPAQDAGRGENGDRDAGATTTIMAGSTAGGAGVVGAVDYALALLARVVDGAPTTTAATVA